MKKFFRKFARNESFDTRGRATITARRIYILPTRYGFMLASLLFLMLLGALNYANNPAYLLTFLLISLSLNAMYQTWQNLRGVQIQQLANEAVFCGQNSSFRFQLNSDGSAEKPAIQINFNQTQANVADLGETQKIETLSLTLPTQQRGLITPGTLVISTQYPLGLFRAWSYIDNAKGVLVYPELAEKSSQTSGNSKPHLTKKHCEIIGNDDFLQLRKYHLGDSPRQVDWKAFAKERGLMSKQFSAEHGDSLIIDWQNYTDRNIEKRLSLMARTVVDAEQNQIPYALHLPHIKISSHSGQQHKHRCLAELALFNPKGHSND